MECMDFALRQKPDDSCIMQQTLDGGDTWTDVFDFSQCVTIQDKSYQISIQNQVTNVQETFIDDIYNNYTTNYAGLPADVHPNLAPPAGDDSALKAALCNAIWEMIRIICDAAIAYYRDAVNQSQQEAQVLLAIAAFTLAAIALAAAVPTAGASLVAMGAAAPLVAAGIGLGAGLANYLVDYWQQHTIDQFQDSDAMEEVACYLVDELAAGDKSLAELQAALVGHGLTGNAAVIADSLSIMLQNDGLYAAFLEKWNNNLQYAEAGIDLYCPCATLYRVWTWNFENGLGPFTIVSGHGELGSDGLYGVDLGNQHAVEITMTFNPTWRVRTVKWSEFRDGSITHGSLDSSSIRLRPTPGSNTGAAFYGGGFMPDGDLTRCFSAGPYFDTANQFYFQGNVRDDNPGSTSTYRLEKIIIVFEADYAKGGYVTDDSDICS
jgi:hypothetical protein